MLSPGSKGWINKFLHIIEDECVDLAIHAPKGVGNDAYLHALFTRSGILYGYPSKLLFSNWDDSHWTTEEKVKLLLFESLLLIHKEHHGLKPFDRAHFVQSLVRFYGEYKTSSITKLFTFFVRESDEEKIESILAKRVDIRVNYLENELWVNYLHNVFIYLDVLLYRDFLKGKKDSLEGYENLALNALNAITLATYADDEIGQQERTMFSIFLASANLSDENKEIAEQRFKYGTSFGAFTVEDYADNWLFKRFLIDLSAFTIFSNHQALPNEKSFLLALANFLSITEREYHESLLLTEQFLIENQSHIPFLRHSSSIEKVYASLSKRWIKVLGRNKEKLVTELKQSKELLVLIHKSTKTELSREEKDLVKTQFLDIVKSMPSLAIFLLPGGAVLLPLVLKIIPDLIPSAFKDNEIEKPVN